MKKSDFANSMIFTIFFLSGCAGLIYEVVWLRILVRVLGCTVYATSTVLGAFMAGLALGSFLLGRYIDHINRPLRFYIILEIFIAITGLIITFSLDSLTPLYQWIYSISGKTTLLIFRASFTFICLIIPTLLMGGTLPVLSKYITREKIHFGNRIGFLYGANTLGAVFGVLFSGFFLIGYYGELKTVLIAILCNICAALFAFILNSNPIKKYSIDIKPANTKKETKISPYPKHIRRIILFIYAISGLTALGYEVVWTRILQLFLETSIYSFSTMLSIYLIGIAIGSLWGRRFIDQLNDPIDQFSLLEVLIGLFSIIGLFLLPYMDSITLQKIFGLSSRILTAMIVILPVTFILGMLFPIASRCYTESKERVGSSIGSIYALNTIGCILGSLLTGFIFLALLGTKRTILLFAIVNILLGITLSIIQFIRLHKIKLIYYLIASIVITLLLGIYIKDPFYKIIKKRIQTKYGDHMEIYLHKEEAAATTTAFGSKTNPHVKHLWMNGIGMTELCVETKLMAHIPILLTETPKNVLIICFGMGSTLRSAVIYDNIHVDVVELVPAAYDAFVFFHADGPDILNQSNVNHYVDDGRNFLLMKQKTYDVITIDPSPPIHSAGTVNLYTKEFIELCKNNLSDTGTLCLWIPPSASTEVKMVMSTFKHVFLHATCWKGFGYPGFFLIGQKKKLTIPYDRFEEAFKNPKIMNDINELGDAINESDMLTNLFLLDEKDFHDYIQDEKIITDDHPYTEFPLWRIIFNPKTHRFLTANHIVEWKSQK